MVGRSPVAIPSLRWEGVRPRRISPERSQRAKSLAHAHGGVWALGSKATLVLQQSSRPSWCVSMWKLSESIIVIMCKMCDDLTILEDLAVEEQVVGDSSLLSLSLSLLSSFSLLSLLSLLSPFLHQSLRDTGLARFLRRYIYCQESFKIFHNEACKGSQIIRN